MRIKIAERQSPYIDAGPAIDFIERVETVREPRCTSGSGARASDRATVQETVWIVTLRYRPDHVRPSFVARVRTFKSRRAAVAHYEASVTLGGS